jgi:hypothetical protein
MERIARGGILVGLALASSTSAIGPHLTMSGLSGELAGGAERPTAHLRLPSAAPARRVRVPGLPGNAASLPAACVHSVPNGATVDATTNSVLLNGSIIAQYAPCSGQMASTGPTAAVPSTSGYSEYWYQNFASQLSSGDHIDYLTSSWTVPPGPTGSIGDLVFLWDGVLSSDSTVLIQPVLQWGDTCQWTEIGQSNPACDNGNNNGQQWILASWYVNLYQGAFYSAPVGASANDQIYGTSWLTNQVNGYQTWSVVAYDSNTGQSSYFNIYYSTVDWTQGYPGVLEWLSGSSCNQLPNSSGIEFSSITAAHGYPNYTALSLGWQPFAPNNYCDFSQANVVGDLLLLWSTSATCSGC